MTLDEIKNLVYPNETIDWITVIKELILKQFGENKLIQFSSVYLYSVGDPNEYVWGLAVIGDRLFALTDDGEGYDCEFGTAFLGNQVNQKKGIGLTEAAIIRICRMIFEGKIGNGYKNPVAFDFSTMEGTRDWFKGDENNYFLKGIRKNQEAFDSFVEGKSSGYFNIT